MNFFAQISFSRHHAASAAFTCAQVCASVCPSVGVFEGSSPARPDIGAVVSSGYADQAFAIVKAFEAIGLESVSDVADVAPGLVYSALRICLMLRADQEQKIRGLASAISFCIENPLELLPGARTDGMATQLCAIDIASVLLLGLKKNV